MTAPRAEVQIRIDGEDAVVVHPGIRDDRSCRLFFGAVLGGTLLADGWRVPRRKLAMTALVVRINTFLERKGWRVSRAGLADRAVRDEVERKRSYQRARDAAIAFRAGHGGVSFERVGRQLEKFGWTADRELLPHQRAGVLHSLAGINTANFSVPGAGKTATTLAIAATHLVAGTIDLVLVVGPLSCFGPWEREARMWTAGALHVRRVRGPVADRRSVYGAARKSMLLLLSYASAAADKSALIDLCRHYRVMLIVDEAHRVKRFRGGLWAPALVEIAAHCRVRTILTGTPMPQGGRDLFSQLNVMWPAGELTGPRDGFAVRVDRNIKGVLRDVQPFMWRTPKSALGLPEYSVHRIEVPLDATQADVYELVRDNFRKRLEDAASWQEKLTWLRRARPVRLLQAAANPDLLNKNDAHYRVPRLYSANRTLMDRLAAYRDRELPAKTRAGIDLLKRLCGEGRKVVCWSNFVPNLDHFAAQVRGTVGVSCYQIDGRVPAGDETLDDEPATLRTNPSDADTRERLIDEFLNRRGPAVLVTNPASCSESISLHRSCQTAVYLDRTYDCALYLQSIDRIHRLGLPRGAKVELYHLLVTHEGQPTIDHLVEVSLARKEAAMRRLLEGAELAPLEEADDPLADAEGDDIDLEQLLRYLLGEDTSG